VEATPPSGGDDLRVYGWSPGPYDDPRPTRPTERRATTGPRAIRTADA
jgi:hypothetical protein